VVFWPKPSIAKALWIKQNEETATTPAAKNALFIPATPKDNQLPYHYTMKLVKITAG
jgi:hypothetical protein